MSRIHFQDNAATVIAEPEPGQTWTEIPDELWARYQEAQQQTCAVEAEIREYVDRARRAASWADAEEDDDLMAYCIPPSTKDRP